ncbi:MAG: DUF362 domain-containing protein [Actinobacteria bacterium]|nr:MAG: DUF362 domain-containing protein [Actinomycetota bacterium]
MEPGKVAKADYTNYQESVYRCLDEIKAAGVLAKQKRIIIKPNLVSNNPPPTTTDVGLVEAIVRYCQEHSQAELIVTEGSGNCSTDKAFEGLGYYERLKPLGILPIDLDTAEIVKLKNPHMPLYKEIYLPKFLLDGFLISAPALKEHGMTTVTLGIKNMVGILPASKYCGLWLFRKSMVHRYNVHQATADICFYRPIDLTIIDGAMGQLRSHLFVSGKPANPFKKTIIASFDPLAADYEGARVLGADPLKVKHLRCYASNLKNGRLC